MNFNELVLGFDTTDREKKYLCSVIQKCRQGLLSLEFVDFNKKIEMCIGQHRYVEDKLFTKVPEFLALHFMKEVFEKIPNEYWMGKIAVSFEPDKF